MRESNDVATNEENERQVDGSAQMKAIDKLAEQAVRQQDSLDNVHHILKLNFEFLKVAVDECQFQVDAVSNTVQSTDQDIFEMNETLKTINIAMQDQHVFLAQLLQVPGGERPGNALRSC
jgi:hypothetical protein